jgi:hypothetical protein
VPSQPPDNFERQFDFTNFSQTQPNKQQPGDKIDLELDEARQSINQTISRLNEIQRDDGQLRDGIFDYTEINNLVLIAQGARDDAVTAAQEAQGSADDANGSAEVAVEAAGDAENFAFAANNSAIAALASQNASAASAVAAAASELAAATTYQDFLDSLPLYDQDLNTTNDVQFARLDLYKTFNYSGYNVDASIKINPSIGINGEALATSQINISTYNENSGLVNSSELAPFSLKFSNNVTGVTAEYSGGYIDLQGLGANFHLSATDYSISNATGSVTTTYPGYITLYNDTDVFGISANNSEVGAWGFGTALGTDNTQFTTVEFDGLHVNSAEGATHVSWDGITFPDGTVQSTAAGAGDFLPLAGGTMTGNIIFGTAGQFIGAGLFDTSRGGVNGISLVCSVGYEFNWQAGWLITTEQNSTTPRPLYLDSVAGTTLRAWDATNNVGTEVSHTGITFGDTTVQTTAWTGSYNPFDQTLNTTDNVKFGTTVVEGTELGIAINSSGFYVLQLGSAAPIVSQLAISTDTPYLYLQDGGVLVDATYSSTGINLHGNDGGTDYYLNIGWAGITFPDGSSQGTAFPPTGGTTLQYIDGTGALQTFPAGGAATTLQTTVYNNSGSTIPQHSLVYINGSHGNDPTVALAQANTEATSRSTLGFTTTAISDNSLGTVTQVGLLEGINTNSYAEGALLFLSPTTAGEFTDVQPYSPNHYVNVGTVIRAHPTLGTIQVRITNSNELVELSDVSAASVASGDILVYNGSGLWVAQAPPTASTSTAGKVQLATDAEVIAGTDSAKAVTASSLDSIRFINAYDEIDTTAFTYSTAVSVHTFSQSPIYKVANGSQSTAIGSSIGYFITRPLIGASASSSIDWSKKVSLAMTIVRSNASPAAGCVFRAFLGKPVTGIAVGDLSASGIGAKISGSGVLQILAHDGTTLTTFSTSYTPTGLGFAMELTSDGSGNVNCFVNGSSVGSTTGGPTSRSATANLSCGGIEVQQVAITSPTSTYNVGNIKISLGLR